MIPLRPADLIHVLPEIMLCATAIAVMVLDPFLKASRKEFLAWLALAGVAGAAWAVARNSRLSLLAFNGSIASDRFSLFFIALFLLAATLTILGSMNYLQRDHIHHGEYYALILMATAGASFMAASTELILIFIGLEISSLSTYILAGFKRTEASSNEASLKYFLLGSFATAFFLYGVAFVYGTTGTANLLALGDRLSSFSGGPSLASAALILMFIGLAFKVSTVPFHVWTPDVYQGAPAPVTAFLSVAPKAGAFAVLVRLFLGSLGAAGPTLFWVLWLSAALTMCVGNLAALAQTNFKRMLGYSSIAHAGYVMVGIAAGGPEGVSAVLYYLAAYALMNAGVFLLLGHLAGRGERHLLTEEYAGLAYERPGTAALLTVLLLSLAGIPTTAGFLAKFYVFRAALHSGLVGLTLIAVLNSVVSVYYYLRPVVSMYMREGRSAEPIASLPWALRAALAVSLVGIFYLGLFPNSVWSLAALAGRPLP